MPIRMTFGLLGVVLATMSGASLLWIGGMLIGEGASDGLRGWIASIAGLFLVAALSSLAAERVREWALSASRDV